jgi:flagellar hook-basal body complex protein FliE
MSDLRIGLAGEAAPVRGATATPVTRGGAGFGEALARALGEVNALQQTADASVQDFSLGRTRDVAGTLIAVEKANLGFQLTLQIRNRLLEAYQEVMRMPL